MKAEIRKFLSPVAFIILLLFLVGRFITAFLYNPALPFSEHIYNETAKQLEGELTEIKSEWVEQEIQRNNQIITEFTEQSTNLANITRQEFEYAKQKLAVLKIYQQKCSAYSDASEFAPVFFEDLPLWRLFRQYESDYFAFAAFLAISLISWGLEFQKGLRPMLLTSINGKKRLFRQKYIVTFLIGFTLYLVFTFIYLISVEIKEDLVGFNHPIQSLLPYAGCKLHCSIRSYLFLSTLFKAWFMGVVGGLLAMICSAMQEISSSAVLIIALIMMPVIIRNMLPDFLYVLSTGIQLFSLIRSSRILIMASSFQTLILIICYFTGSRLWSRRIK